MNKPILTVRLLGLLAVGLLWVRPASAQEVTIAESVADVIRAQAQKIVESYCISLTLFVQTDDDQDRRMLQDAIFNVYSEGRKTFLYNDLQASSDAPQEMAMDDLLRYARVYDLETELFYEMDEVSDIYYATDGAKGYYYVKVVMQQEIKGSYGADRKAVNNRRKVDFYVRGFAKGGSIDPMLIYGSTPHQRSNTALGSGGRQVNIVASTTESASARSIRLTGEERQAIERNIKRRVSLLTDYINIIASKDEDRKRRRDTIEDALKLFMDAEHIVQIPGKKADGSASIHELSVKQYLTRLFNLQAYRVEITFYNVVLISDLKCNNGKCYGTASFVQKFVSKGEDGGILYMDETTKRVEIEAEQVEKRVGGTKRRIFMVRFGDITVKEIR